ncbi:ketosamine-3-kinase isoform X2 [Lampris incognitus]|uniref:ketosamine-3-kinase isoform X2 n=1 Tax=Lampris incognitus TaxID=2546036 RepID=UPI0024B535CD|nr:ketosamine-3-kinase isoform X2 [Lampris incognitus]
MEAKLKKELGTSILKTAGHAGGGCISEGQSYDTDTGRVFVKINHKSQAKLMFDGEMASLNAILKTGTIKVPKPVKVIELDTGGAVFVMEHVDMRGLSKYSKQLGEHLAAMHLHNKQQLDKQNKEQQTVGKGAGQSDLPATEKFGFHVPTCCGYLPQENEWQDDWVTFYSTQRLQHQLSLVEKSCGDREARELWSQLQMWRLFLLCSTETYGEAMWQSAPRARSSLTLLHSMVIQNLSSALQGCSVASTVLSTLLTMTSFPRHQVLLKETSYTNFFTI